MGLKQQATELATAGIELVNEYLPRSAESIARERMEKERTEREARQAAEAVAQQTAREAVAAYLAKPRKSAEIVQNDINTLQAERSSLLAELVGIKADAVENEVSAKVATRCKQIELTLDGFGGRMGKLQAELADCQQAAIVAEYQDTISAEIKLGEDLIAFENSPEWLELEARYKQGVDRINRDRLQLKVNPLSRRDNFVSKYGMDSIRAVGDKLNAIDLALPNVVWK